MMMTPLNFVEAGKSVKIIKIAAGRGLTQRLSDMGLLEGEIVRVVNNMGGPLIITKNTSRLAPGRGMGAKILVEEI